MKRVLFAIGQTHFFLWKLVRGEVKLGVQILRCGWPNSRWESKYLVLGQVKVHESEILLELGGSLFSLRHSPQRDLFLKISSGDEIGSTRYGVHAKKHLSPEDYDFWVRTKLELQDSYNPALEDSVAVVSRRFGKGYVVQDGAHRLALRNLNGQVWEWVWLSIWSFR